MAQLPRLQLTLVIGRYAQLAYFPRDGRTLTELVRSWREHPAIMPLPHPSPLNNRWLKKHPWFEQQVLPPLRERVSEVLNPYLSRRWVRKRVVKGKRVSGRLDFGGRRNIK